MNRYLKALLFLFPCLVLFSSLPAQDEETEEVEESAEASNAPRALAFKRIPARFSREYPFKANSTFWLAYNAAVDTAAVEASVRFYDESEKRSVPVKAERPSSEDLAKLRQQYGERYSDDHFVKITPDPELPLDGQWALLTEKGLASQDGKSVVAEGHLDRIGWLRSFEIRDTGTSNEFDQGKYIYIYHNKSGLHEAFDTEKLSEFISIQPRPENFSLEANSDRFTLNGDFEYGQEYVVALQPGIIASDETQLNQAFEAKLTFAPNDGFVSLPAFHTTQSATGKRLFEVHSGNLTGLRTRVKHLTGEQLVAALEQYKKKYEGGGEARTYAFEAIEGEVIYDEFAASEAALDTTSQKVFSWDQLTGRPGPGAYYFCTEGKSATQEGKEIGSQSIVQLTDIGLIWKRDEKQTLIYTFSLSTGKALPGVELRVVEGGGRELSRVSTDAAGLAAIDSSLYHDLETESEEEEEEVNAPIVLLDAVHGEDRHVMDLTGYLDNVGLWSFGINSRYDDLPEGARRNMIFTDRGVYRPGDEVKIKVISRQVDTDRLLPGGGGQAILRIKDSADRVLQEKEVTLSAHGTLDDSFMVPTGRLGYYSIELDFNPPSEDDNQDWELLAYHGFQVEEYRVNTFEVSLDSETEYAGDETISIPVSAKYYMGKSLSKSELVWNVSAHHYAYPRPHGFDEFVFGDRNADYEPFSTDGREALSTGGTALIEFELPEQGDLVAPRGVSVVAQVTDANQQTISRSSRFTVHSSDYYLGLREPEGVFRAGDAARFFIAAAGADGKTWAEGEQVNVLVEKKIWNTVKVMGSNGKIVHRNEESRQTVFQDQIEVVTGVNPETGLAEAVPLDLNFKDAGTYVVTLNARDNKDRAVNTSLDFEVIGAEEPAWSWHDVVRVDLIPDKEKYQVGDTAKLLLRSPVFGQALLTTERGGVRSSRAIDIDAYETVIDIPVTEEDAPNIFASVLIVRGSADSPHVYTSASYRLGYTNLNVEDPAVSLAVRLDSGAEESFQPGQEVEVAAVVTDAQGAPVSGAEVTLYAVDEGVLSLTAYTTPRPGETFHAPFPLSVFTGQSISDLLPENPQEQDFGNKGYVIGGGGDGQANLSDPDKMRKDFKALAFWQPTLVTGADGRVMATFEAPDNLTTFRLIAVVSEGSRFGQADKPLVVNKPLMLEPALPGFSNLGDQIDITAVLHNTTTSPQEVEVEVRLDERAIFVEEIGQVVPTVLGDNPEDRLRTVKATLGAGATETLSFPVAFVTTGEATWSWQVKSSTDTSLGDLVESKFNVGFPLPLLREVSTHVARSEQGLDNVLASVNPRLLDGNGQVRVSLSNSRLVEAGEALEFLLTYPYGCLEQTTSSLIPWLTTRQLQEVLPPLKRSEEEVNRTIEKGLAALLSRQTQDGGLSYWAGGHSSDPAGSAYAGLAIAIGQAQGFELPEAQVEGLWEYLSKVLREEKKRLDNVDKVSQHCLALYTLALAGVNETAYHDVYFAMRHQLSAEARALLALAMIESGSTAQERIEALLQPDPEVPVAQFSWYREPYIAATRLLAEVRRNPGSETVETRFNDLMNLRQEYHGWGSTYSNAWPLLALASYGEHVQNAVLANEVLVGFGDAQENVSFTARASSKELVLPFDGDITSKPLKIQGSKSAPVYANVTIETRPQMMPVEPENKGFGIARTYEKVDADGSIHPAENLQVGDLILVSLQFSLPHDRENYLAIDDPLPAIFEAVNPTFSTQATQKVERDRNIRRLPTSFRELRRDRALFFADSVYGRGDYQVQYLARVVAAGVATAPAAKIESMYEPHRFGLSGTSLIKASRMSTDSGAVAEN